MIMKKTLAIMAAICGSCVLGFGQTARTQVIENGGNGAYKAVSSADESLPTHTIYRPDDLKAAVAKEGKLPVLLYANGGCANRSQDMSHLLTEVASHGYIVIAIGPYEEYDETAFYDTWRGIIKSMYPSTMPFCTMGNGEDVYAMTPAEAAEYEASQAAARQAREEAAKKASRKKAPAEPAPFRTYPRQLLEALDWITDQNAQAGSEYYHMVDLDKVAVMGQSCGGAQALACTHDPRVKTAVILNSGMGEISMGGASKASLANLHTPMFYLIGGPADVAYKNALGDYANIGSVPVVMANTKDGHHGTYYAKNGGRYAKAVTMWLNWQLKGQVSDSALFMNDEYEASLYPDWTFERKNW